MILDPSGVSIRKYLRKLASEEATSISQDPYGVNCPIHSHKASLRSSTTNVPTTLFLCKKTTSSKKKILPG